MILSEPWRCDITGNPVGTDTEMVGRLCQCQGCRASEKIARLEAELAAAKERAFASTFAAADEDAQEYIRNLLTTILGMAMAAGLPDPHVNDTPEARAAWEGSLPDKVREAMQTARREALKEAVRVAAELYPRGSAHTYASENADRYRAQEETCEIIAARIRALIDKEPQS